MPLAMLIVLWRRWLTRDARCRAPARDTQRRCVRCDVSAISARCLDATRVHAADLILMPVYHAPTRSYTRGHAFIMRLRAHAAAMSLPIRVRSAHAR